MITLRNFDESDTYILQDLKYGDLTHNEIKNLISEWNIKEYEGKYFEMFAVIYDSAVVGCVSLFHQSESIVSCGAEIFEGFRRKNYAYLAVEELFRMAKSKGYKIAIGQVRIDNTASIALCRKLGLETDKYEYINKKGKPVYVYMKSLFSV